MPQRVILLGLMLFGLCGCSIFSIHEGKAKEMVLLPPAEGPGDMLLKQAARIETKTGEKKQFMIIIRLNKEYLKLRALLATGQPLLSLDYDGRSLKQHNVSPFALPGEDILALIQFALWPEKAIKKAYGNDSEWLLELDSKQRNLSTAEGKVASVNYLSFDEAIVVNYRQGYRVIITTLEKKDL